MRKRPYYLRLNNIKYDLDFVINALKYSEEYQSVISDLKEASELLNGAITEFAGDDED